MTLVLTIRIHNPVSNEPTKQTMGSFGGATQAGMSYGARREIVDPKAQEYDLPSSPSHRLFI